jgi:transposase
MTDESRPKYRIAERQRKQAVMVFTVPEDALPPTHPARVLWDVVGTLDRSRFLAGVKSVEGTVGRKTLSPRRKLVLWLYAVQQGMGSAREIARRRTSLSVEVSDGARSGARCADDRHPRVADA